MATGAGSGDRLARGLSRAQFPPAGGEVTQEKWDSIFRDFNPEKHKKESGDASKN